MTEFDQLPQLDPEMVLAALALRAAVMLPVALVCLNKGKPVAAGVGLVGIAFFPLEWVGIAAAVRLARPQSRWAGRRYDAEKMALARARFPGKPPPYLPPEPLPADQTPDVPWTGGDFIWTMVAGLLAGVSAAVVVEAGGLLTPEQELVTVVAAQYGGHLAALWWVTRRRRSSFGELGLVVEPSDGVYLVLGVGLQIALGALVAPLRPQLEGEGLPQSVAESLPQVQGTATRLALVVGIALLAPVVEEALFRGLLLRSIGRRTGLAAAVYWSGLIFAFFHILGLRGENLEAELLLVMPALVVVGVVLGRLAVQHRRLGPAIFTHAGFNLVAVLQLLVGPQLLEWSERLSGVLYVVR